MKVFSVALLVAIIGTAIATPSKVQTKVKTTARQSTPEEVAELIAAAGGCNVNVCFALDGSGSVTPGQFNNQKNFVFDVMNIIAGNPVEAAAVQYGLRNRPISFLTADIDSFFLDLDDAEFSDDIRTSVGGGIVWCHGQLRKRSGEALKIVVLGDGRNNLGGSPARRARRFRNREDGEVCVVGIGYNRNLNRLLNIAGGNPDLVLTVGDYDELRDIIADLALAICGVTIN